MKFLCDRCNTRYSIGDDRVRGKILKIRCKSCSNVITVREGMVADPEPAPPVAPEYAGRAKKTTTMAPEALEASPATRDPLRALAPRPAAKDVPTERLGPARTTGGQAAVTPAATGALRAAAPAPRSEPSPGLSTAPPPAAKPPPALEEEWYVSIDGDQAGPFSLADAQRWVAGKPLDTELHCWSEGFDDWLPVDKVSHFRGLRKRPAPSAPPPLPGAPRPAMAAPLERPAVTAREEEPKALFAATMASLERGAPPPASPRLQPPPPARATPPLGVPPRSSTQNGVAPAARPLARPEVRAIGAPFDVSEGAEGETQADARRFDPIAEPRRAAPETGAARPSPAGPELGALGGPGAPASGDAPPARPGSDSGDELDIGEVSRVVKLADLVRTPRPADPVAARRGGTAAVNRLIGAAPSLRSTGGVPALSAPASPGGELASPADVDAGHTVAPVAHSHRRGLIALLSVAGVMVLGVVGAVILLVNNDDTTGGHLGSVRNIDTSRPEDPITHRPLDPQTTPTPQNPLGQRPATRTPRVTTPATGSGRVEPETPTGSALDSAEIEDAARKHQDVTQRCYMRAQRGADSILVGDVKKIAVTLTIDRDGNVSEVQLSDHAADNLGKCLIGSMRGWKFRPSAGGTFRFSLNFVSG